MRKTYKGKIVLKESVIDGYVTVTDDIISYVGTEKPDGEIFEVAGYIAPGFVDIHCHSCPLAHAKVSPETVAKYHLERGTTTMLLTYYRDIPHERLLECLANTKKAMETNKNIYGAHLEGPYVNPRYGCGKGDFEYIPNKANYDKYIEFGVIRQWMCSPEVEGTPEFIADIAKSGIVPAIGHSEATYEQVKTAYEKGARITTHIFDATKAPQTKYGGTLEVDFNEACMLMPEMYYEVICDRNWVHVRKEKLQFLLKVVGIDRVCAITDAYYVGEDTSDDVNFVGASLTGSKLTMAMVARNLFNAGYTLPEIFKMVALNPSKAIKLMDCGEIAVGKQAKLIEVDESANFKTILNF